jgi:PPM family protein phosphatase
MARGFGVSDPGPVRKVNEDSFLCNDELQLYVVADGMGGHSAGEVASRLAVEAMAAFMRRSHGSEEFSWPCGINPKLSYDGNRLRTAVFLANRRVFRAAESHDDYTGMGSTIVAGLVSGNRLSAAHVGDSRLYVARGGELTQLTEDDTWAATVLSQAGGLSSEDLAKHPMRNVLTNVLGARDQTEIHVQEHELAEGDVLLLCSDGLHGALDAGTMLEILRAGEREEDRAARLVRTALERGARDNVTAVVITYGNGSAG